MILRVILQRELQVMEVHTQYQISNLQGRTVKLDIAAVDIDGKWYDIEIQRDDKGAQARRARHNSSMLDAMNYSILAERVRHLKKDKEEIRDMGSVMEELREEGREEGIIALIETCQELGIPRKELEIRMAKKFRLEDAAAQRYLEKYWK